MIGGCSDGVKNSADGSSRFSGSGTGAGGDLGQDWEPQARGSGSGGGVARTSNSGEGIPGGDGDYWTVLLKTFPGVGREPAAATMIQNAVGIDRRLADAHIHSDRRGSLVVFGRYPSADSDAAQRGLSTIKSIEFREQPVFPRAMLTRIRVARDPGSYQPHELLSARLQYPEYRDMCTLQIGVWVVGGDIRNWDQARERANREVLALRANGSQAYVHHDADKQMSMITVGIFDASAYDVAAGMVQDPRLQRAIDRHPVHTLNGEQLEVLKVPKRPDQGTEIQRPQLVVVPDLP